jgi:hypothetical protein
MAKSVKPAIRQRRKRLLSRSSFDLGITIRGKPRPRLTSLLRPLVWPYFAWFAWRIERALDREERHGSTRLPSESEEGL